MLHLDNSEITIKCQQYECKDIIVQIGMSIRSATQTGTILWAVCTFAPIDHSYDESKPEIELTLQDMRDAAEFQGGEYLPIAMEKGDWKT